MAGISKPAASTALYLILCFCINRTIAQSPFPFCLGQESEHKTDDYVDQLESAEEDWGSGPR